MHDHEYEWTNLHGVKCIIWLPSTTSDNVDKKSKTVIKRRKNDLGKSNLDTPILDVCHRSGRREFCDAIIYSDNVKAWENSLRICYKENEMVTKTTATAKQIVFINRDNGEDILVIHIYYKQCKIMVQPGNIKEKNLIDFIKLIPSLRSLPNETDQIEGRQSQMQRLTVDKPTFSDDARTSHMASADSADSPTSSSSSSSKKLVYPDSSSSNVEDKDCDINTNKLDVNTLECKLRVNIPPLKQKTVRAKECQQSFNHIPLEPTSAPRIVHNELLCFIQNRTRRLQFDIVRKLCVGFYSAEDIVEAKELLFKNVATGRRNIKRTGEDKKKYDVEDMITVFLELKVPHTVHFVAYDLSNLPPLSVDNFDVIKLINEVDSLKTSFKLLCNDLKPSTPNMSQRSPSDHDLIVTQEDSSTKTATGSSPGPRLCPVHPVCTCVTGEQVPTSHHQSPIPVRQSPSVQSVNSVAQSNQSSNHQPHSVDQKATDPLQRLASCSTSNADPQHEGSQQDTLSTRDDEASDEAESSEDDSIASSCPSTLADFETIDDISWTDVTRKHPGTQHRTPAGRQRESVKQGLAGLHEAGMLIGEGPRGYIGAVHNEKGNHMCTGLLVTRLKPQTSCAQLAAYVYRESSFTIQPEKIPSPIKSYSSFFIRCNHFKRQQLMSSYMWPKGAIIKRYYDH